MRGRCLSDKILIRGPHPNLKNIDLTLPRDKLIVITGLSGSGKSSLAFDTLYAEGPAPLCRVAVGLRPAVPVDDGKARCRHHRRPVAGDLHRAEVDLHNPRSTVGTITEIYDYLRLLLPASAFRAAPDHDPRWKPRPSARWSTRCWPCPKAAN